MSTRKFSLSRSEMEAILQEGTIGFLGLSLDGMPYVVPLNYGYINGKIYFHCALTGKKLDYIKGNPEVCFTVGRQTGSINRHTEGDPCHLDSDSVICYGKARIIVDLEKRKESLDIFNRCFRADAEDISLEAAAKCCAVEIEITKMTGRQERDRKCTHWKYTF
jgi:nitroimidazol reductase NimA-like FMN-containing flavoprotein (pyridoxamine 5'-phosphate oxidase superfamily)